MNNLLVAIYNQKIYEELLKEKNINIINKNILYKEGIIEVLENNLEINYIIINEKIPGEIELNNLIYKIKEINKNIKIILIIEESKKYIIKSQEDLIIIEEENITKILEKIENIKNDNINKELEKIIDSNTNDKKEKINDNNINNKSEEIKTNKNIYLIKGNSGSGKSIISTILSYKISQKNKKVLLIDCDIEKGNIHTIFQTKKEENKTQKIYNNLYFINTDKEEKIKELFMQNYDIFILDNYNKYLQINYKIIYLLESNLIEIEKLNNKNNKENNFRNYDYFIINKYNKNSIDEKILEKILENKNILKIKYNDKYNFLINNFKIKKDDIYFEKEYRNIIKKII